jgi:hypothetical protein
VLIDVSIPCYRTPHPLAWSAIQGMIAHSTCKCWQDSLRELRENVRKVSPMHPMKDCPRGKHDVGVPPPLSGSILHWSRNAMIQACRPQAEYVLLCDDDMVPSADHLDKLLAHRVDIVAGICTKRIDPPVPNARRWIDQIQNYGEIIDWDKSTKMLEVDAIGTGFMLLSRKAIKDIAEAYHPEDFKNSGNGWWFEYIRTPKGGEWGEDISFCWKAKRIGLKVYCDLTVNPGHVGDYIYRLDDYLAYQDEIIRAAKEDPKMGELQLAEK